MARRNDGERAGKGQRKRVNSQESHGFHVARRFLAEYGQRALDMRTRAGKDLAAWKDAYIADLGGQGNVSIAQLTLLEVAATQWFLYEGLRAKLVAAAAEGQLEREPIDLLRRLGDSLAKHLQTLGLEKRKPPPEDLSAYIEEQYGERHDR